VAAHAYNFNTNSKDSPKINRKVKSVGQECPTHTGGATAVPPCRTPRYSRAGRSLRQECTTYDEFAGVPYFNFSELYLDGNNNLLG